MPSRPITVFVFLALAALHLFHALRRFADPDEFQALVNAFDSARGLTPYIGFWDNHGPLNIWLLQPIFALWTGGHSVIYWLRGLLWLNTLAVAAGTFYLARRLYPRTHIPTVAILTLLTAPAFLSKALEIRGDNPANLLATAALILLVLAFHSHAPTTDYPTHQQHPTRSNILYFAAGLTLGLITGFTLKALIIIAGLALFTIAWHIKSSQLPSFSGVLALTLGTALPIVTIAVVLHLNGNLLPFISCYFGGNVTREFAGFTSSNFTDIYKKSPVWSTIATAALFTSAARIFRCRTDPAETGLTLMILFYLAQFLLLMPTKNMQSLLPLFVPLSITTAIILNSWFNRLRQEPWFTPRTAATAALILAALLLRDLYDYCGLDNKELPKQVRFADRTLALTAKQPAIFDPSGIVFLKPKPGPFHVLVTFIREMHQAGIIDLKITEILSPSAQPPINHIVLHKRTGDLRLADIVYIRTHFGPILHGPDTFLLKRNAPTSATHLSPKAQKDWQTWQWEDAKIPTQQNPTPPTWYQNFITREE